MVRCSLILTLIGSILVAGDAPAQKKETKGESDKQTLRVGTFQRTEVLVAFYHSEFWHHELQGMMAEAKKAKADGDQKKVADLEAKGAALQAEAHRQLTGKAPLTNLLDHLKKEFAAVAKEGGVTLIVEEPLFRDPSIEVVDITPLLVKRLPPVKGKDK
jgi:hypothetical protein